MHIAGDHIHNAIRPRPAICFQLSKYPGPVEPAYSTQEHMAPGVFSQ